MRALAPNPFMLVDFDRHGWSEPDPHISERARRREIVNAFLKARSYWAVIRYLSEGVLSGAILPQFWSLDEAAQHYGAKLKDRDRLGRDQVKARYVVARYFRAYRWHWLEAA